MTPLSSAHLRVAELVERKMVHLQTCSVGTETEARLQILNKADDKEGKRVRETDREKTQ